MANYKYTKEFLEPYTKSSFSVAEILRKLGLRYNGGSYSLVSKRIKELGLDTSHFTGQLWSKGKKLPQKLTNEEYFVKGDLKRTSHAVRLNLFKRGIKDKKCESCLNTEWQGNPIPLEVHHIDGDKFNNQIKNLKIVCPNCHYFTDTYKMKNRKK